MSFWTFILLISIAGLIYSAWRTKHLSQHGMIEDDSGKVRPIDANAGVREVALQREVEELRERIKVLERIATDDPSAKRLSAEIDALRDARQMEQGSKQ